MTTLSEAFPSPFIVGADLGDQEVLVTMAHTEQAKMQDGTMRTVLFFQGKKKGLILNKTNWVKIASIHGSDDSDDWVGKQILLYSTEVTNPRGETVEGVRIRAPKAVQAKQIKDDLDDEIPF
jgi:hypothetical protein